MLTIIKKLIAGGPKRKTRLHDEKGNLVSVSRLLRNGPNALVSGSARLIFGVRPERPWISYDAQRLLQSHLTPLSRVLEFGSGMSTMWYAQHAGHVVSIEDDRNWYDAIGVTIRRQSNVDYRFAANATEYVSFPDGPYDLIMIDGSFRAECVEASLASLAPSGILYLDNSDKNVGGLPGNVPEAERLLLSYARKYGCQVQHITDFAPTQLFVQEGLMVRRP